MHEVVRKEKIQLSDHFTYKKLLKFTFPAIVMMIFSSIYGVVDGFFVSNFAGKTAFTSVNLIMPFLMILGTVGFMFGAGGGALIAKTLGQGDREKANRLFSLFVYTTMALGVIFALLGLAILRPVTDFLGKNASQEVLDGAIVYGRIILIALPFFMLQYEFQSLFATAEKPQLGLIITLLSGVANMLLDALFVGVFDWGLVGAALATAVSQAIGGVVPVVYFAGKNSSLLRLTKTNFDYKALLKGCANGASELMSNVSMSLVAMLYNAQLLNLAGDNGVAAYGVLMYVNMIFLACFIGYSVGTAPVFGFHYGAQNRKELRSLLKKSGILIGAMAIGMFVSSELLATPLARIFIRNDKELLDLTVRGFRIFSFSFLFAGFAIFGSSFFTALNDGVTSAIVSFLRTLVFQVIAVLVFPLIMKGVDGIWWSVVFAEAVAVVVNLLFVFGKRKKYGY